MQRPARVLDRENEWDILSGFVAHPEPHLRLAVVAGRRRVGKSYLLRALVEAAGGMYVSAVAEEDSPAARRRFANAIATYARRGGSGTTWCGWPASAATCCWPICRRSPG